MRSDDLKRSSTEQYVEDDEVVNPTSNRPFQSVLQANMSRRGVMRGGLASAALFTAGPVIANGGNRLVDFRPVPNSVATGPVPSISPDYQFDVLIPWGEPLEPNGPAFSYPPNSADQAKQIGIGHDGMWFFPRRINGEDSNTRGLLAINHEFGNNFDDL